MSNNRVLPKDHSEVVRMVREYLAQADMAECEAGPMAESLGSCYSTVQYRLRKGGTSWERERRAEKARRLRALLDKPGKLSATHGADVCGFYEIGSFFRFFKEVMGKTYTDYYAGIGDHA